MNFAANSQLITNADTYNIRGTSAQQLFINALNSVSDDYMFRPTKWSSSGPPSQGLQYYRRLCTPTGSRFVFTVWLAGSIRDKYKKVLE